MTQFQVDSDALLSASASLRGTVAQMQSLIVTMNGQLNTLASSWSGTAALAFHDLVTEWQATQRIVESNLDEISLALSTAHAQYTEVEAANLSLFRR
jgi:WXG100 family type VII secretion target